MPVFWRLLNTNYVEKMTSSTKPEVHHVWHSRNGRTEPRSLQVTYTKHLVKFGPVVVETFVCLSVRMSETRERTDTQTRASQYLAPYRGVVIKLWLKCCYFSSKRSGKRSSYCGKVRDASDQRLFIWQFTSITLFSCTAPSTPATESKQYCRMLQVERFVRQSWMLLWQSRTLLRHCCRFLATMSNGVFREISSQIAHVRFVLTFDFV